MSDGHPRPPAASHVGSTTRLFTAFVGLLLLSFLAAACSSDNTPIGPGGQELTTPEFSFKVRQAKAVITEHGKKQHNDPKAKPASVEAAEALSLFYSAAFLDPANWSEDTYGDNVFSVFSDEVRSEAEAKTDVLTAASVASDTTRKIRPIKSDLRARVLMDEQGEPAMVTAIVSFRAKVVGGSPIIVRSKGQYFFSKQDGAWKITAFEVERHDEEGTVKTKPSPSGTQESP